VWYWYPFCVCNITYVSCKEVLPAPFANLVTMVALVFLVGLNICLLEV
jgi:hypothetical protein